MLEKFIFDTIIGSNLDQIFNHLYLENEKNCDKKNFLSMTFSHNNQLPGFFQNLFQNHPV
jgi:hypothetical protein